MVSHLVVFVSNRIYKGIDEEMVEIVYNSSVTIPYLGSVDMVLVRIRVRDSIDGVLLRVRGTVRRGLGLCNLGRPLYVVYAIPFDGRVEVFSL